MECKLLSSVRSFVSENYIGILKSLNILLSELRWASLAHYAEQANLIVQTLCLIYIQAV